MTRMTYDDVVDYLGAAKSTVNKWKAAPDFPKPVEYITQKKCWWDKADIDRFKRNRAKQKFRS